MRAYLVGMERQVKAEQVLLLSNLDREERSAQQVKLEAKLMMLGSATCRIPWMGWSRLRGSGMLRSTGTWCWRWWMTRWSGPKTETYPNLIQPLTRRTGGARRKHRPSCTQPAPARPSSSQSPASPPPPTQAKPPLVIDDNAGEQIWADILELWPGVSFSFVMSPCMCCLMRRLETKVMALHLVEEVLVQSLSKLQRELVIPAISENKETAESYEDLFIL